MYGSSGFDQGHSIGFMNSRDSWQGTGALGNGDAYRVGKFFGAPEDDLGRLPLFGVEATVETHRTHGEARRAHALEIEVFDAIGPIQRIVLEDFANFSFQQ